MYCGKSDNNYGGHHLCNLGEYLVVVDPLHLSETFCDKSHLIFINPSMTVVLDPIYRSTPNGCFLWR